MPNVAIESVEGQEWLKAGRPIGGRKGSQTVQILNNRGFAVNSLLTRDEWVELDRRVLTAARPQLRIVNALRSRGLIYKLGGLGSLTSRWYTSSDVTPATINMTGRGSNRDLPEMIRKEVPIPVIWKDFELDMRSLMASRRSGDGLDTAALAETSQVIAEAAENLVLGLAAVSNFNGLPLYGILNHPSRNTVSATGDWGTIANILTTVTAGISAAMTDLHYGPYMIYASTNQYNEAALNFYSDGTGDTPRDRILRLPNVSGFEMLPFLPDGTVALIQMTDDVLDYAEPADFAGMQLREWTSNDGLASGFKLMMVGAPRIKSRQDGKCGIVHVTGA